MKNYMTTYDPSYHGLPIQASTGLGCYTEILERFYSLMHQYVDDHNKTLFIRFDLHFPQEVPYEDDNHRLKAFLDSFKTHLSRIKVRGGHKHDPQIFWVRERTPEAPNHHYHLILLLNGNATQQFFHHLEKASELWEGVLGYREYIRDGLVKNELGKNGLINYCIFNKFGQPQENGIMIRRVGQTIDNFNRCFHWGSYLSKTYTKGLAPPNIREYGCPRISS